MTADEWIHQAPPPEALTGDEAFIGLDARVRDFWSYALRDLRSNTTRGILAEWFVARAVGATQLLDDWNEYDVVTPSGLTVECKSSAYLQAWDQRTHSTITFGGLKAKRWTPQHGYSDEKTFNADVYVFCLQTARNHEDYDPLDVNQWRFYVLSRSTVSRLGFESLSLRRVEAEASALHYAELAPAIAAAGSR